MVGLSSPGEGSDRPPESEESGGSEEAAGDVETGPVVSLEGGETVEFFEEERPLPEAVQLMAQKLDEPGSFGLVSEGDLRSVKEENDRLREKVTELAEAVEILAARQAELNDLEVEATVELDSDVFDLEGKE